MSPLISNWVLIKSIPCSDLYNGQGPGAVKIGPKGNESSTELDLDYCFLSFFQTKIGLFRKKNGDLFLRRVPTLVDVY